MRRRTLMKTSGCWCGVGVNPSLSAAADICLYDKSIRKLIIVSGSDFSAPAYPSSVYSPVGVVVVPGTHNVYGDGSCGVMSLKGMSFSTPDTGSTSEQEMCWGWNAKDILKPKNYNAVPSLGSMDGDVYDTIQGTKDKGCLPSDNILTGKDCPHDTDLKYYTETDSLFCYIPSPYNDDDTRNPMYYQTSSPSNTSNALSDFDGVGNTKIITDLATGQYYWKTESTITNSYDRNYYPAACCCWRYHTDGTSQGQWYLPACGELGYIIPKFSQIQKSIRALISAYGDSVGVTLGSSIYSSYNYWSSSEGGNMDAMSVARQYGYVRLLSKSKKYYVRAWLRVGA